MIDTSDTTPRPASLQGVARVLVVGFGVSGVAAARLLADAGVAVRLVDERADAVVDDQQLGSGVEVLPGTSGIAGLTEDIDLVVPSPGVPDHAPVLVEAARRAIPIWSEPELALRVHPRALVAVTGTNGKTSTTELLAAILREDGRDAVVCGNIGRPVSDAAATAAADALLVAELSSFQLRFAGTLRPEVGVVLNLAPDHLDWHADEAAYQAAKARLWEAQGPDDWSVANADDPLTMELRAAAPGRPAAFSGLRAPGSEVGVGVVRGRLVGRLPDGTMMDLSTDVAALPPHRVANAAAAATVALLVGASPGAMAAAIEAYRPGRHRYELVATSAEGVAYVDDSKATNPHAARAALGAAPSIVWIAGGQAKGIDLGVLADDLDRVRAAVLIGEAADELERLCARARVPSVRASTVEEAVEVATDHAQAGDTVLLAPACASFDQFRDYAERGERFTAAVRSIVDVGGSTQGEAS